MFFYAVLNSELVLVDAPGYGFAKGNTQELESWGKMIVKYLKFGSFYHRAICLIDVHHGIKESDVMLFELLEKYQKPFFVTLTKCDKVSNLQIKKTFEELSAKLKHFSYCSPILIGTSSK
jgi:GTP-binding protein